MKIYFASGVCTPGEIYTSGEIEGRGNNGWMHEIFFIFLFLTKIIKIIKINLYI